VVEESRSAWIRIGDPDTDVQGRQSYDLSYRLSSLFEGGAYCAKLFGFDWGKVLYNATFSVRFPRRIDGGAVRVYAGPMDARSLAPNCSYAVGYATVRGACAALSGGVTVALAVDRFYFGPTVAQCALLGCAVASVLLLGAFVGHRLWILRTRPTDRCEFHPIEVGLLLGTRPEPQWALLYLAAQGAISLKWNEAQEVEAALVNHSLASDQIGQWFLNELRRRDGVLSGSPLTDAMRDALLIGHAYARLHEEGYIISQCSGVWLVLASVIVISLLSLTEFARTYQTLAQPMITAMALPWVAMMIVFVSLCSKDNILAGGKCRVTWFACFLGFPILGFFLVYLDRPIVWDTVEAVFLGVLSGTLLIWDWMMLMGWRESGTRAVGSLIGYKMYLETMTLEEGANSRAVCLMAAYLAAFGLTESESVDCRGNVALGMWTTWAATQIVFPVCSGRDSSGLD
jgi:hypothetical protein